MRIFSFNTCKVSKEIEKNVGVANTIYHESIYLTEKKTTKFMAKTHVKYQRNWHKLLDKLPIQNTLNPITLAVTRLSAKSEKVTKVYLRITCKH